VNVAVQGVCPGVRIDHGGLPTDPAVTAMVLRALSAAPLTPPPDCATPPLTRRQTHPPSSTRPGSGRPPSGTHRP
jgi:hypothetical protein